MNSAGKTINQTTAFLKSLLTTLLILIVIPLKLSGQDHHDWSYNLSLYEVNVRQYTSSGTIGVQNRVNSLGSYYSVQDYYDVNPEYGTLDDFKALVDSIHSKGMYIIIDWVGNHSSRDNILTTTHPEWYVKDSLGNFTPPPGTNWSDVIQLDYSKQNLRDYMIEAMKFWINETNIDGFRCDAVSFMPLDFWKSAIADLKKVKPGLFMLAEDDGIQYQAAGFDMSYAWRLLAFGTGILKDIVSGKSDANMLDNYVKQENKNYPAPHYRMYFTSNHDENSWHGTVFEQFGKAAEVFAVLTLTFRSMPLIYNGQEAGLNHRLLFFDKDQITWQQHPFTEMYSKLLHLKRENKALWNGSDGGQLQRVTTTDDKSIFAFIREKGDSKVFVILNLTDKEKTVTLEGSLYKGNYRDVFIGDSVSFNENSEITLPGWGYNVYEIGSN